MADERIIPGSVKDGSAIAYNLMAERIGTLDLSPLLIYYIDNLPAGILPYLAEQFHIAGSEGWRMATTDSARRDLLKLSRELHRYKGTYYAIERAIQSLGLTCTIKRWWEYAAAPYHFRVIIDLLDSGITEEQQALLTAYIDSYKSLRDVQDPMQFNLAAAGALYIGLSVQSSEITTVYPG